MKQLNDCFKKYKNKHKGESCIFFGTGPSVSLYKSNNNLIKIGVNEIIYNKEIELDYYFIGDPGTIEKGFNSDKETYINYNPKKAKFYREKINKKNMCVMPAEIGGIPYEGFFERGGIDFSKDITDKLIARTSISFEVMQFLLYAGFKKIYLVGHDCDYKDGTFHSEKTKKDESPKTLLFSRWNELKKFIKKNYPKTSVHIVNPISLNIFPEISIDEIEQEEANSILGDIDIEKYFNDLDELLVNEHKTSKR